MDAFSYLSVFISIILGLAGAALTRREAYHGLVAVCTAVLFAVYVGLLFTRLR